MISKIFLLLILPLFTTSEPTEKQSNINLEISNIQDSKGQLVVSIYSAKDQFPKAPFKVLNIPKQANSKVTKASFYLEEGHYAIVILNDVNSNGEMDYRLGIYPKEAFGFSNNATVSGFKSPSFEDCLFKVQKDETVNVAISLNKI
ncbi:DUF2141 domain-containing protein [Labilibacter sediminis]|nr:DUF2141 domain-containing protein [Labilibacter sediminis]